MARQKRDPETEPPQTDNSLELYVLVGGSSFGAANALVSLAHGYGRNTLISSALTIAYTFAVPPLAGVFRRAWQGIETSRTIRSRERLHKKRSFDPGLFDLRNGYWERNSEFKERAGRFLDDLQTIEEGKRLVEFAKKKGVAIRQSPQHTRMLQYDDAMRLIKIPENSGGQFDACLLESLALTTHPFVKYDYLSRSQSQAFATMIRADAQTTSLSLAWQLNEKGISASWNQMIHDMQTNTGHGSAHKFALAVFAVPGDLMKARELYMQDWYASVDRMSVAERIQAPTLAPDASFSSGAPFSWRNR